MNRFNLSFKGEIQPGFEPGQVKARFGKMFGIDDPVRLERFFTGDTIVLRRNLERKTAAEYYSKLRKLGVEAELIKVTAEEAAAALSPSPVHQAKADSGQKTSQQQAAWEEARREAEREAIQRRAEEEHTRKQAASEARKKDEEEDTRHRAEMEAEQQRIAEVTARRKAEEEQARQQAEEEAQIKAEKEAARRQAQAQAQEEESRLKAEEEAARRKAEEEKARQKAEEETARRKAQEEEARLKAAEEAARRKVQEEEARRKAAEEAAQRKAKEEEARRKAAEEAAQRKAKEEEARRKAAEEAARRKAQEEEARRKAAAEAARLRAEQEAERKRAAEETARKKAEEAARRKAERKKEQQRAAQAAAQREAERAEKQRIKAEQAAQQKAMREAQRREAAEKAAIERAEKAAEKQKAREEVARRKAEEKQRKAEETARRKAAEEEARLRAAEAAAVRAAEKAERQRLKAEEIARKKTAEAERRRLEREEAERKRAAQAKEAGLQKARQRAERDAAARQEKEARERARTEQEAAQANERARKEAAHREQESHRAAMEEQAISRAAKELNRPLPKPVKPQQLPGKPETAKTRAAGDTARRKRQAGAPNLFSLRPFRNTAEVKSRVDIAQRGKRRYMTAAVISLALAVMLALVYSSRPTRVSISGASAAALPPGQGPMLLADNTLLMHDRAGLGIRQLDIADLGLSQLGPQMSFTNSGELMAFGKLATTPSMAAPSVAAPSEADSADTLVRCQLESAVCKPVAEKLETSNIASFSLHPLDGSVFLLDAHEDLLVRLDAEGSVLTKAEFDIPAKPVMRLEHGLLFMNSDAGPAISVFRYDNSAFGKQLDEILLLPPPAVELGQQLVRDFIWNAQGWWVTLTNADTGSSGVYRFDVDWNYTGTVPLSAGTNPEQLLAWGEKTLVRDSRQPTLQRFNAVGEAEVPMHSPQLQELVTQRKRVQYLTEFGLRGLLLATALIASIGLVLACLDGWRTLVYRGRKARGAQPVDELADAISWVAPEPRRQGFYRRVNIAGVFIFAAMLMVAIAAGISVIQLAALLVVIGAITAALLLLQRSPIGHIGVVDGQLLLVDHANLYHLGSDARVQYRGPFLMLDDVLVFTGNNMLPAFSQQQIRQQVQPLAEGGVRVDRKTVVIKSLQARHPLARACSWIIGGCSLAVLMLLLQW